MRKPQSKINYKPLWKLLVDKNMKKKDLIAAANISAATITKMARGGHVTTNVLERICVALNCSISDIIQIVE